MRLYDTAGKSAAELEPGVNDGSRIPAGVYFLRAEDGSKPQKVVIQH